MRMYDYHDIQNYDLKRACIADLHHLMGDYICTHAHCTHHYMDYDIIIMVYDRVQCHNITEPSLYTVRNRDRIIIPI